MSAWQEDAWLNSRECAWCGSGFDWAEWEDRHSDHDGQDVHAGCCPICIPT